MTDEIAIEPTPEKDYGPPAQVTAYQGYGIYADYDANAPDSAHCLFVSTEELAKLVCAELNKNARKYGNLAYTEGWEWCKSFQYAQAIELSEDTFCCTLSEAMSIASGDEAPKSQ